MRRTARRTVTIAINGANDAAVITGTASGSVTEKSGVANATAGVAKASGDLDASDVDSLTTFAVQSGEAKTYGTFSIDASGAWSYTLDDTNAAVQALNSTGANTTLHELVTVATADGTTRVIDVTIGANDAARRSPAWPAARDQDGVGSDGRHGQRRPDASDVDSPRPSRCSLGGQDLRHLQIDASGGDTR